MPKDVYTQWNKDRPTQVYRYALLGKTEEEMCELMAIDHNLFNQWKRTHEDFLTALRAGRSEADTQVAESFYKCATGYYYTTQVTVKVKDAKGNETVVVKDVQKYQRPDAWAASRWLALRLRGVWSEVHRMEVTNTTINIAKIDLTGFSADELRLMEKMGAKQLVENASGN